MKGRYKMRKVVDVLSESVVVEPGVCYEKRRVKMECGHVKRTGSVEEYLTKGLACPGIGTKTRCHECAEEEDKAKFLEWMRANREFGNWPSKDRAEMYLYQHANALRMPEAWQIYNRETKEE